MNSLTIPVEKVEYVSFTKESYDSTIYNNMIIQLKSGNNLRTNLSFTWKKEDEVPAALLDFIVQSGLNVSLTKSSEN